VSESESQSNDAPTNLNGKTVAPLAGITVVDMTRLLSGPFATMILGDLGADVIKIEKPDGGDDSRHFGPPFYGDDAAYFVSVNRNKRSISVNLGSESGRVIVRRLAQNCDVFIENFRPGVIDRMGLGFDALTVSNPKLIYASISGFGATGPLRNEPGYDAVAQAMSGLMSITGEKDGPPVRAGISIADIGAGMWATIGILAALNERNVSGRGQYVDVSLLDGQISWLSYVAAGYLASGDVPMRYGSGHPSIVPYRAFRTADSEIMIGVGNDAMWSRFVEVIGTNDGIDDAKFAINSGRVANRHELESKMERVLLTRTADEWLELFSKSSIVASRINTVQEALENPQVQFRGMITKQLQDDGSLVRTVASPIKLSRSSLSGVQNAPSLGQHTEEILRESGYSDSEITSLKRGKVV